MDEVLKQRVTLLDIAADAGVSRATVSLVIRNVPSVADSTRKRVQRSIKRLGYIYHRGAASLRTQQSHAIGLIVSDITNPFFAEVIVAIEERLAAARLVTLLGNTSEDHAKEERLLKTMKEFPADGILICPAIGCRTPTGSLDLAGQLPAVPAPPIRRGGHDTVQRLLQMDNRPTAALCFNDVVALGVIEALQHAGVRTGKEFGVVGFNNVPDAAQSLPGLTTIDTSPRELGATAAELLLKRIEQRDSPIRTVILQPRLIVRQSCGTGH